MSIGQWPLAVKLWGAFAALTLMIFALLAILLPWTLKGFFTEQLYDILLDTQSGLQVEMSELTTPAFPIPAAIKMKPSNTIEKSPSNIRIFLVPKVELGESTIPTESTLAAQITAPLEGTWGGPAIRHFMISGSEQTHSVESASQISEPFIQAMEKDAFAQLLPVEKYTRSIDNKSIFYVIRKELVQGQPNFIVSYAWGNYRNDLVMTMLSSPRTDGTPCWTHG